jgi:hypothetical protein
MPLTPIVRRTLAIFRERPVLFTAFPLLSSLLFLVDPVWLNNLSPGPMKAAGVCILVWLCVGLPLSYAVVVALTLEAEEASLISFTRAWRRICHRRGLVRTAFLIEFLFVGLFMVIGLFALVINPVVNALPIPALHPASHGYTVWIWIRKALVIAVIARVMIPVALAIPLVLMKHSEAALHALDESWRLARGIFWFLAAVTFLSVLPDYILPYFGSLIHAPASMTTAAGWTGKIFLQVAEAVCSALSYIAFTLIALNRSATDPQPEALPSTSPPSHPASQVVIL